MNKHKQEKRDHVLQMYISNQSITCISKQTGISRSTIYRWIKEYQQNVFDAKGINLKLLYDLKRTISRMKIIIDILQNAPCTTRSSNEEKCIVIKSLADKYSESLMCYALKISKSTYFNYKRLGKHGLKLNVLKRKEITPIIEEIFQNSKGVFGAPKICAILRERGYTVSPEFVSSIMHENGWFASRGGAKKKYLAQRKKNILNRQFNVDKPNEVWVGDVTCFSVDGKAFYLCAILDLYSRKAIAFRISSKNSTQLTKRTFKEAYESRGMPKGLMFHSDQGCNYTSFTYQKYLKECGVTQSFSKPSTPYDNSVMESFFKNLKNERIYIINPQTERAYKTEVAWYINFYNTERPHETLHYMTPDAFEALYYNHSTEQTE